MQSLYLITGISSGIGRAIATELCRNSENTVVGFARKNDFEADNFQFSALDLSDIQKVKKVIFPNPESFQKIVLINNAGTLGEVKRTQNQSLNHIEDIVNVNYTAMMILSTIFVQTYQKIDAKKLIINVSSGAAHTPYASWANYCATKAALEMWTKCQNLEQQTERFPIRNFAVAPGIVDTKMQAQIRNTEECDFEMRGKVASYYEEKKLFTPEYVAQKMIEIAQNPDNYSENSFRILAMGEVLGAPVQ